MTDSSEVQVLDPARWRRRISEAQGRRREARSEGSVEQNRDPMDKNRIRGLPGRTSEPGIAKSAAIKGRGGRSGGRAVKAVVEPGNLKKALARVQRNKGAPGIDGMTVDELGDHLKAHWPEIRSQLLAGRYTPQPVRRVE